MKNSPFYDGTIFHRVIAGFVNQGGARTNQTNAGYQFVDEFTPSLRHDSFGVLSSANSGPDSNGSQYFITVSPQPALDDVHTIFGRLFGGSNVVYAINQVATDGAAKPLTNVVLQSLVIRRIGSAAQAFDINARGLPLVTNLNLQIARAGTNVSINFSNRLNVDNRFYSSTNLAQWVGVPLGIVTTPSPSTLVTSASLPARFFRMAQIQYQDSLFVPYSVSGRTMALNFTGGNGTITITFDNNGGGSYTWTAGPSGSILFYNWIQDPYRGRFRQIFYSGIPPMDLHLDFDTATSGTFKGTVYPNYPSTAGSVPASGTFSSTP
jgi:cyclophilin family peptidyl-prolyl cis-trans isomerase